MTKDGNVWMNQKQLAELFDTSKQNIGQHIHSILTDNELKEKSVVKNYFTTTQDGKKYEVTFYALDMILAIGFRVRSKRGTQLYNDFHQKRKTTEALQADQQDLETAITKF